MSKVVEMSQLDLMSSVGCHLYVLVAGGMGAGKSYVIGESIKNIPIFDIDDIMEEMGFRDYTRDQFSAAMEVISKKIDGSMVNKRSMVAMGTSSNVTAAIDRLHNAKLMGYETVLIHVDTPVKQAILQNRNRIEQGNRGVSRADEHKIERTTIGAANTVATLRETALVDYFVYHNNTRKELINE